MTSSEDIFPNEQKLFNRVSMSPLYERLLKIPFPDTVSAIEHCRNVCADFGFTVKQEASANRNIYVYCSREGLPDSQRNPKPAPQRKRPSKRCDCRWRVVLSENDQEQWEFRKSMNPNASEHNHDMMGPNEMVKAWPPEVNEMIIYLAQQRLQTHEIRDAVKQRFPHISWNERRFYNRLTEERKRIRQRSTAERTRRLILLSAQLCAVVAANEEWSQCVEGDLHRMFDNFCQLTRLTPEAVPSLVDLHVDAIQNETERLTNTTHRLSIGNLPDTMNNHNQQHASHAGSNAGHDDDDGDDDGGGDDDDDGQQRHTHLQASPVKKRKASTTTCTSITTKQHLAGDRQQQSQPKGTQCVSIPGFNVFVRSQSLRASSESSQGSRRTCDSNSGMESPTNTGSFVGSNGLFSLASPTSSSSSSTSSVHFRQQPFRLDIQSRLTSPPQQQASMASPNDPSSFVMTQPPPQHQHHQQQQQQQQHQQQQQQQQPYSLANLSYNMQNSFSPYSISTPSFSSPNDMSFTLDSHTTTTSNSTPSTSSSLSQHPHHLLSASRNDNHHHHHHHHSGHHSHHDHQEEQQRVASTVFTDFCPSIKEERSLFDRSLTSSSYTNAPLPMIRPNGHPDAVPTASEPNAATFY